MTWERFWRGCVVILLAVIVFWFFQAAIIGRFQIGIVGHFIMASLQIIIPLTIAWHVFGFNLRAGKGFLSMLTVLVIFFMVTNIVSAKNPSAVDSADSGATGLLTTIGDWMKDPFLRNRITRTESEKTCDDMTAQSRGAEIRLLESSWQSTGAVNSPTSTEVYAAKLKEVNERWDRVMQNCKYDSKVPLDQQKNDQYAQPPVQASSGDKKDVFVDAKSSSGADPQMYIKTGTPIAISGTGNAVWKNIAVGNPTKYEECGPAGTSPTGSPLLSKAEYMSNINDYLCPTALKGALIAKIGDGPWFSVGANYKGEAKQSGKLLLAINDVDPSKQPVSNWQDNDKGFQVTINVN